MHHLVQGDPTLVAKKRSTREILRRVASYLRPYKLLAAATIGCAMLSLGFSLAYPKLTQFVIDDVIRHKLTDLLAPIMFATNPTLALVAMTPLPLLTGGALWYTLTAHHRYRAQREAASAMNALLMDNLQGVRQIKAFGREPHEDDRFAARADDLRKGT